MSEKLGPPHGARPCAISAKTLKREVLMCKLGMQKRSEVPCKLGNNEVMCRAS